MLELFDACLRRTSRRYPSDSVKPDDRLYMNSPFFDELHDAKSILIAGGGGGFDVFCGLPIYFELKRAGKTVHLANLSSGALGFCDAENPVPALWRITRQTAATKYFRRCICRRG